jgi:hypothetical protein
MWRLLLLEFYDSQFSVMLSHSGDPLESTIHLAPSQPSVLWASDLRILPAMAMLIRKHLSPMSWTLGPVIWTFSSGRWLLAQHSTVLAKLRDYLHLYTYC